MPDMEDEEYGDIADEDLIEAFSQASQTLPAHPPKRFRDEQSTDEDDIDEPPQRRRRTSQDSGKGDSGSEVEGLHETKKKRYRIHIAEKPVPAAKILGATQAEELAAMPDSSPYRIRGPIYRKPRPEVSPPPPPAPIFNVPPCSANPPLCTNARCASSPIIIDDDEFGLADLPSDAFSTPEKESQPTIPMSSSSTIFSTQRGGLPGQRLVAPQNGLRQTTLFGGRALDQVPASQVNKRYNYIVDKPPEAPTHHVLNTEALKTWVYPTNLGEIRDYQFTIVKNGLFNNTLVALPTGLGKTCIAATIMLNYFRWTKDAKIVFVAPTKPLVAQQVDACFNIVGIPKSQTTMLTGEQAPALRAEEWQEKRIFFMTPQTLENDLASGIADPKKIVLLVVDEAHRATGNYAYVRVVSFIRRFSKSFRILALTATPGASVESVQEVIDNLEISQVEIRTEDSFDIKQYVHSRNIDEILHDPSEEITVVKEHLSAALQPLVNQLCSLNAYYHKDPMSLTPFGLMTAQKQWANSNAGRTANMGLKGMAFALFTVLASVAHSIKLLNFHGISPFYSAIKDFRQSNEERGKKPSKYKTMIIDHPDFKKMMDKISLWISKDDFIGHPKLTSLCETILNHFLDANAGRLGEDTPPSATRVIVFSEYRDSAEDIARILNTHGPLVRATVFVGQQDSKRSEGMNQTKQLETLRKFKSGVFNVIVATSIGEEGLDIGQVDLIVCYDSSSSPIRMLQRMGRTGRKRSGKIVLLLMKGKEQDSFTKAKDNYEKMQKMITSGAHFALRHDLSVRIVPRDLHPVVDKKLIQIPIENTQDPSLPEPKRRPTKPRKKPEKKFHMPDGVQTGFTKASKLSADGSTLTQLGVTVKTKAAKTPELAPKIAPESVLLTPAQERAFREEYLQVEYSGNEFIEVSMPDLNANPAARRSLGPSINVPHGQLTKRTVAMFQKISDLEYLDKTYSKLHGTNEPSCEFLDPKPLVEDDLQARKARVVNGKGRAAAVSKTMKKSTLGHAARAFLDVLSDDSDAELISSPSSQPAPLPQRPPSPLPHYPLRLSKAAPVRRRPAAKPVQTKAKPKAEARKANEDEAEEGISGDEISGYESEGAGDEIHSELHFEEEESEGDIGSLKDFLAPSSSFVGGGNGVTSSFPGGTGTDGLSSSVVRGGTPRGRKGSLDRSDDEDDPGPKSRLGFMKSTAFKDAYEEVGQYMRTVDGSGFGDDDSNSSVQGDGENQEDVEEEVPTPNPSTSYTRPKSGIMSALGTAYDEVSDYMRSIDARDDARDKDRGGGTGRGRGRRIVGGSDSDE